MVFSVKAVPFTITQGDHSSKLILFRKYIFPTIKQYNNLWKYLIEQRMESTLSNEASPGQGRWALLVSPFSFYFLPLLLSAALATSIFILDSNSDRIMSLFF
jgi:hypothetical protein